MDRTAAVAEFLLELRQSLRIVEGIPADIAPRTPEEGYGVQELLVRKLLDAGGGHTVGYKIACTSEMAQRALGVNEPFFGTLLSHTCYRSGVTLPASAFTLRCIEAEFGFEIAEDVPIGREYTSDSIAEFIGAAIPSIEIVDHRYRDWKTVGAPSLLADNAIHGAWVAGEPRTDWRGIDYARHPVLLIVNGMETFPGSGAAVLGNPLNVVAWLANELPKYGRRLRRGDRITTGVTTDIYMANPGDHLIADFGALGKVQLTFSKD